MAAPFMRLMASSLPKYYINYAVTRLPRCVSSFLHANSSRSKDDNVKASNRVLSAAPSWRQGLSKWKDLLLFSPFSTTKQRQSSDGADGVQNKDTEGPKRPLKLMNFPELLWPHPLKSIKNVFLTFLIRGYFDQSFSSGDFLKGGDKALSVVSHMIANGQFDDLKHLVNNESIQEIKRSHEKLTPSQRAFIAVDTRDIFLRFIYEIGMIIDDKTNERFVEVTAVFQGIHGMADTMENNPPNVRNMKHAAENTYVCNYSFIRNYTKGVEDDWTISRLNHFLPSELVKDSDPFSR